MADIAKSGTPSLASIGPIPGANKLPTLVAGENIAAGDACYVKSDGKIWRAAGGAALAASTVVDGFAPYAVNAGETITLFFNVTFNYGSGLTPGAQYFLSATTGALADAATVGSPGPCAFAVDATRIYVFQTRYKAP